MSGALDYAAQATARVQAGQLKAGSHLAGVFGKVATMLETQFRDYTGQILTTAGMDYATEVRPRLQTRGSSLPGRFNKLTLGQLRGVASWIEEQRPGTVGFADPVQWPFTKFVTTIDRVNLTWRKVKHGEEPSREDLVQGLHDVHALLRALNRD